MFVGKKQMSGGIAMGSWPAYAWRIRVVTKVNKYIYECDEFDLNLSYIVIGMKATADDLYSFTLFIEEFLFVHNEPDNLSPTREHQG